MSQSVLSDTLRPLTDIREILESRSWEWDKGVFASELVRQSLFPRHIDSKAKSPLKNVLPTPAPLTNGTYKGTRTAATELYRRIEDRWVVHNLEMLTDI
jgi:hypothetical protein